MAKRYFEHKDANSKRFWEVSVSGKKVNIRYGKLGTDGQTSLKELSTPAEAKAHAEKQAAGKVKKGYKEAKVKAVKKAAKKKVAKQKASSKEDTLSAVEGKSMNVRYMRVSFGDVDADRYDARACINHKKTCFIMVEDYGEFTYIQIGDYVKILGKTELEEELPGDDGTEYSFNCCAKHLDILCNTNREERGWLYGFMKSCWYANQDGLEGLASISDAEEEVIEFFEATGLCEEHDGMGFCLMEICSLAIKMSGDKVVCNGKTYKFKDVFNLMDGWADDPADHPPIPPAVSKFRSKHGYFAQMCIWGIRHLE